MKRLLKFFYLGFPLHCGRPLHLDSILTRVEEKHYVMLAQSGTKILCNDFQFYKYNAPVL